jgi:hypothetical protein
MRALVALIVLLALLFVGFGTYFTFHKRREAERLLEAAYTAGNQSESARLTPTAREEKDFSLGRDAAGGPRHDLAKIGLAIAASLDKSRLPPGELITTAPQNPLRWFYHGSEPELKRRLARVRGAVMIGPRDSLSTWMVFLYEAEDEADRKWLSTQVLEGLRDSTVATFGIGHVLGVLVMSSSATGKPSHHTPAQVQELARGMELVVRSQLDTGK